MVDIGWLTQQAHNLHGVFASLFYSLILTLLLLSVVLEYFKLPLGQTPAFGVLVGRALIAVLLLISYQEMANLLAAVADGMTDKLGGLDNLDRVLQKMGQKVEDHSTDWLNARSLVITALSFLTYTFLFYSVIIAEVAHVFTWTLLYVASPLLISLCVLPATSGATKALYRSLVEVACWKVCWAALSSLLWASVLIDANSGGTLDFIKMICINLMLGGSLIATPWIVHALGSSGLAGFTRNFSGIVTAAGVITPARLYQMTKSNAAKGLHAYKVTNRLVTHSGHGIKNAALFSQNPVRNTKEVATDIKEGIKSKAIGLKSATNKAGVNLSTTTPKAGRIAHNDPITPTSGHQSSGKKAPSTKTNWQKHRDKKKAIGNQSKEKET